MNAITWELQRNYWLQSVGSEVGVPLADLPVSKYY